MPRQARLDARWALHCMMGCGIEGARIYRSRKDREDFLRRVEELRGSGA